MDDSTKQKNMLMTSIMRNPKLAKQFSEALSAPIGSTKRQHIKSTLSIMKKLHGAQNDGQGGPIQDIGNSISSGFNSFFGNSKPSSSTPSSSNNNIFFPSPGALKADNSTAFYPTPSGQPIKNETQTSTPDYGNYYNNSSISGNALQNVNLPSKNYDDTFNIKPTTTKSPEIDYVAEQKKNPINPGLAQIFNPGNLNAGAKSLLGGFGNLLKPVGAVGMAGLGAAGTVGLGALSLLESAASNVPKLITGWNDPSEIISPSQTLSWKGADWLATKSPWMKYLAGTDKPITTPSITTPVLDETLTTSGTPGSTIPSTTGTPANSGTPASTSLIQPNGSPESSPQTGGMTPNTFNIAATSISKMLGTTPSTLLTQIPVINLAGAIATNEGYFNGTSQVAIKNNNPGNLKFANQPGATQDSRGFAVFKTADEGAQALINDITAKYNSGKYSTINDLMSVYSPDSDNPANSSYTGGSKIVNNSSQSPSLASGPYTYASDLAKANFGGRDLTQVINDNTVAYKKALEPLEQQLSDLKAEAPNFVPTLTAYMQGKDQYSKAIDSMIQSAEDALPTINMADPFTANQYTNNLNYLYTLKGRQNARYTTYLNSAKADYTADVTDMQNKVDKFKTDATALLTQQNAIDQSTYQDILTRGAEAWTALDNAPTKALNYGILAQQYYQNGGDTVANGLAAATNTNPKLLEDKAKWLKELSIDKGQSDPATGNLDITKIGPGGLINLYEENSIITSDQRGLTEALRQVFATTLSNSGNDPKKIAQIQGYITKLRDSAVNYDATGQEQIKSYADALSAGIGSATTSSYSGYILNNIAAVKQAVKDLVSPSGGFLGFGKKQPGIQDKAKWITDHSSLDSGLLTAIYEAINNNVQPGTAFASDPNSLITQIFGGTDQQNADKLAGIISNV